MSILTFSIQILLKWTNDLKTFGRVFGSSEKNIIFPFNADSSNDLQNQTFNLMFFLVEDMKKNGKPLRK